MLVLFALVAGCQLAPKDRSGAFTTALIVLGLAASGARKRRR